MARLLLKLSRAIMRVGTPALLVLTGVSLCSLMLITRQVDNKNLSPSKRDLLEGVEFSVLPDLQLPHRSRPSAVSKSGNQKNTRFGSIPVGRKSAPGNKTREISTEMANAVDHQAFIKKAIKERPGRVMYQPLTLAGINVTFLGCYEDSVIPSLRTLQEEFLSDYRRMTVEKCLNHCRKRYFPFVGLEFGGECYCGKQLHRGPASVSDCNVTCPGHENSTCGGVNRLTVYHIHPRSMGRPPKDRQRVELGILRPDPRSRERYLDAETEEAYRGCYPTPPGPELEQAASMPVRDHLLTPRRCRLSCQQQVYTLALAMNATVCQCLNASATCRLVSASSDGYCNISCSGNERQKCGGPSHMSVYRTEIEDRRCATVGFLPDHSWPLVALASYPGSGNTWVRHLIERATGIYTGSYYNDGDLFNKGFRGERENWLRRNTVAVKTHRFDRAHIEQFDSTVLLIRNPYSAMLAEHNRKYAGHTGLPAPKYYQLNEWREFVDGQSRTWTNTNLNWLQYSRRLLVVHYEDFVRDTMGQLHRILDFLGLPASQDRLICLEADKDGKFKRRRHLEFDPYTSDMKGYTNIFIKTIDMSLRLYNQTSLPQEYAADML
ncbi:WSCD2 [Branchiostoma lanceolatum]|uniref:WSCD2 protein n=1 Tax=Branchiostoma lanceolatum TaxID=7740 RepID=A0A8J9VAT3_BRALA|nr:WSCD2 [Branchiostoma lanceolatum]